MAQFVKRDIDRFAEALAEGKSVAAAARAAGFGPSFGADLLHQLEKQFGWQAR